MSKKPGKEYFDGFIQGFILAKGLGDFPIPAEYIVPIEITMRIEKSSDGFSGSYDFEANPAILTPNPLYAQWPGVLAFFPRAVSGIPNAPYNPFFKFMGPQSTYVQSMKCSGKLEVLEFKNNKFVIKFHDLPRGFMVSATAIANHHIPQLGHIESYLLPLYAEQFIPLEFFSELSSSYLEKITLYYNHKILAFEAPLKLKTKTNRLRDEVASLRAHAMIVKAESFYSVVDQEGDHYVKQVPDLEEVRQLFLENPDLASKMSSEADAKIREGLRDGLYSTKLVKMLDSLQPKGEKPDGANPDSESISALAERLEKSREQGPRPKEALAYALKHLVESGRAGNQCLTVVDGCWINFGYKRSKKELCMQVSGDKYIPSKSHFEKEHIKILESLGIKADQYSDDIYARCFDKPRDYDEIAAIIIKIFNEVYRVDNKSSAYIDYVLGSKQLPEFKEIIDGLQDFIPKRDKNKFKWSWES